MIERRTIVINVGQRAVLGRGRAALRGQPVSADVIGRWAVHQSWDVGGEDFTVTHVPSGLALADQMTRAAALELARFLSMSLDVERIDRAKHRELVTFEVKRAGGRLLTSDDPVQAVAS